MRFDFRVVRDGMGADNCRPVFFMRLADEPPGHPPLCLLDTGSLDTFMALELAEAAGIDLGDAEPIDPFILGGVEVTGLHKPVGGVIEDGSGAAIPLKNMPVIFTYPWAHLGFGAILGTIGMQHIRVTVSAGEGWIEIHQL